MEFLSPNFPENKPRLGEQRSYPSTQLLIACACVVSFSRTWSEKASS